MNITDAKVGNIVVCYDEYLHDYVEHKLKVTSIECDPEYATETNPKGIVLYGEDISDSNSESMICTCFESNFVSIEPDVLAITVYYDNVKADYEEKEDGENLTEIILPKDKVFEWFKKHILENFRPDVDEGVSDKGLFEEWLDEYTADDTEGMYDELKEFVIKEEEEKVNE